jgi:NAD(P)-dependent dehydrogenase (short-subunit alcohol dehydrogenase family)
VAVVVGASRGLGRGIAEAFDDAGASVIAVARSAGALAELTEIRPSIRAEVADAADPTLAATLIERHNPDLLALVAGAAPVLRPLHHHTWETFSLNWESDVRIAFTWLREALLLPLRPGSRILVMSSGAATQGSPLSGGYAGAKSTIRFIAGYAADEARRAGLGIDVISVLPRLTPSTELGLAAVAAYAARAEVSEEQYRARLGTPVTPQGAGSAFVTLASGDEARNGALAYSLTGDQGLQPA